MFLWEIVKFISSMIFWYVLWAVVLFTVLGLIAIPIMVIVELSDGKTTLEEAWARTRGKPYWPDNPPGERFSKPK